MHATINQQVLKLFTIAGSIILLATNFCYDDDDLHSACQRGSERAVNRLLNDSDVHIDDMDVSAELHIFEFDLIESGSVYSLKAPKVLECGVRRVAC